MSKKKIVCIGGGIGVSTVLSGLKKYPLYDLTAIVTMFDNGGSSGELRKELGVLPMGDVRSCLSVLAEEKTINPFFHCRFSRGKLKGHNLGNLLIAAAEQITGGLEEGIEAISRILKVKGRVLPVAHKSSHIEIILNNGERIVGEEQIVNCQKVSELGIKNISLKPKVNANPSAISAIKEADLIVFAPGKFYTSIIPNLLVKGIADAIKRSRAKKIFITNLMTQVGNTDSLEVSDFLKTIERYFGKKVIDKVIFNTSKLSPSLMEQVRVTFPKTKLVKYDKKLLKDKRFVGVDLIDKKICKPILGDVLVKGQNARTMVVHDADKLAKTIFKICKQ